MSLCETHLMGPACMICERDALKARVEKAEARVAELEAEVGNAYAAAVEPNDELIRRARHVAELETILGRVVEWTRAYGSELVPAGVDSYGEGVRDCKARVGRIIGEIPAPTDSVSVPRARLDADGTAQPKTEIREVFDKGDGGLRTLFHGAGKEYVVVDRGVEAGVVQNDPSTPKAESEDSHEVLRSTPRTEAGRPTKGRENGGGGIPCDAGSSPAASLDSTSEEEPCTDSENEMLAEVAEIRREQRTAEQTSGGAVDRKVEGPGHAAPREHSRSLADRGQPEESAPARVTLDMVARVNAAGASIGQPVQRPAEAVPDPKKPWRVGSKLGRTLYLEDEVIGLVDEPAIAEAICAAMNDRYVGGPTCTMCETRTPVLCKSCYQDDHSLGIDDVGAGHCPHCSKKIVDLVPRPSDAEGTAAVLDARHRPPHECSVKMSAQKSGTVCSQGTSGCIADIIDREDGPSEAATQALSPREFAPDLFGEHDPGLHCPRPGSHVCVCCTRWRDDAMARRSALDAHRLNEAEPGSAEALRKAAGDVCGNAIVMASHTTPSGRALGPGVYVPFQFSSALQRAHNAFQDVQRADNPNPEPHATDIERAERWCARLRLGQSDSDVISLAMLLCQVREEGAKFNSRPLSDEDLDELEALADAAFPGPWTHSDEDMWGVVKAPTVTGILATISRAAEHDGGAKVTKATGAFIAKARDVIPKLCGSLRLRRSESWLWQSLLAEERKSRTETPLDLEAELKQRQGWVDEAWNGALDAAVQVCIEATPFARATVDEWRKINGTREFIIARIAELKVKP
jgi:hypothetical protein